MLTELFGHLFEGARDCDFSLKIVTLPHREKNLNLKVFDVRSEKYAFE